MAEVIEINFPRENEKNPSIDSDIKNQILDYDVTESDNKKQEECPEEFKIENYYKDDALGKNVLQQKYLAPWEKHPWDLFWKRHCKTRKRITRRMGSKIL